uniref:Thiol disulfide interchange protein DsbD n=1 Tax=Enterobacter cloacae TaxID=550 RepID=A0A6C0VUA2_ENTCL|nr:Thiol disulfide interchange protein DsbD [Enterobacter cloacae]
MTASTIRLRRWLAGLALLLALPATSAVARDFELPPVDEVFVLSAQATAPDRIEVRWRIADGYYLYRHRTSVKADAAFTGATMALPKGKAYRDEFFGDVETYRKELLGTLTGTPAAGASATTLTVKYQGCADAGVCYPPQTRTLKVALPGEAGAGGFGCKARGLHDYVVKNGSADHPNAEVKFALGDVVNTMIGCTNGETIMLCHDTSLPRPYSLGFRVQGTEGLWMDVNKSIYLEGKSPQPHRWEPAEGWFAKYDHPLWKRYADLAAGAGHGGMDWFVIHAFVEALKAKAPMPIDIYDALARSAITPLSEQSIAEGNRTLDFPDFTRGQWRTRKPIFALNDAY